MGNNDGERVEALIQHYFENQNLAGLRVRWITRFSKVFGGVYFYARGDPTTKPYF
jgi:hypothetical protein